MNKHLDATLQTYNDKTVSVTYTAGNADDFHAGFVYGIRKAIEELRSQKKYWYEVTQSAEDESHGWIQLTEDEAALISKVTDSDNWTNAEMGSWTGYFSIDLESKRETKPE